MSETACNALRRYGVRLGRHTVFMPALVKPRAAHTLALLWRAAHPDAGRPLFLARAGALSMPLNERPSWGEGAAAGYRACGWVAVRLDLVEKVAEAIEGDAPSDDAALARLVGRPVRELPGILNALGYHQSPEPKRWRRATQRRKRATPADKDNAFSALADLLPPTAPPRRRRSGPA